MHCQICKSGEIAKYTTIDGVAIFKCSQCELAFVDPKTPRRKTNHIYSFEDYKKRDGQFKKRYKTVVDYVKAYSSGKKVLEVGAGFGLLSSMLYRSGFDVDVLEPDLDPFYLKDLSVTIFKSRLDEYAKKSKVKYDVLILYDVLEHVEFPTDTVEMFKKLLTKKGIVLIQTPNYQSIMARIVRKWSWWMVEDHRYFFSKKSLDILFDKKVWRELFYRTYEEWPDFKKNLDGNFTVIKNSLIRKAIKLIFFLIFSPCYFLLRRFFWKSGMGGLQTAIWQIKS